MRSDRNSVASISPRKPLISALVVGCLTLSVAPQSQALPIPLTTQTIFNFDFTGQSPPAPYNEIDLALLFQGTAPQSVTFNFYGGFNGASLLTSITAPEPLNLILVAPFLSGILDGQFSVGLQSSNFQLSSFSAMGSVALLEGPRAVTGPVTGALRSVPEPSALALLGIAIAGLGVARRKPRH